MKTWLIAIVSISLFASCSMLKKNADEKVKAESNKQQITAVEQQKPAAGDTVVARWGSNGWMEGRVENLIGTRAKIIWADDSDPNDVDLSEIFVMPKFGAATPVKSGEFAIAKGRSDYWWEEVEVKETGNGLVKIQYISDGDTANLPPDKVIAVTPAVAADIKDNAEKEEFLTTAHSQRPVAPKDYKPKVGDHVLAEWTAHSWNGGKIKSIAGDKAMIVWDEDMKTDAVELESIIPFPTADNSTLPAVGDYVLLKPDGGSWNYGQVTGVSGPAIEAKDLNTTRTYRAGEFVILK